MKRAIYILLALCLACGCVLDKTESKSDIKAGDALPHFEVTLDNGAKVSDSDLYGSISLIVFFTTKCADCRAALPEIEKTYKTYAEKGVKFVCISREETPAAVQNMWTTFGLTMPRSTQTDRKIYNLFATSQVPRIYISDRKGIVRHIHTDNPLPENTQLAHELDDLL